VFFVFLLAFLEKTRQGADERIWGRCVYDLKNFEGCFHTFCAAHLIQVQSLFCSGKTQRALEIHHSLVFFIVLDVVLAGVSHAAMGLGRHAAKAGGTKHPNIWADEPTTWKRVAAPGTGRFFCQSRSLTSTEQLPGSRAAARRDGYGYAQPVEFKRVAALTSGSLLSTFNSKRNNRGPVSVR